MANKVTTNSSDEIKIGDLLKSAWDQMSKNVNLWVQLALIYAIPSVILMLIIGLVFGDGSKIFDVSSGSISGFGVASLGAAGLGILIVSVFQWIVLSIFIISAVNVAQGKKISDYKAAIEISKPKIWRVIGVSFLVAIIVTLGLIALIIPGIIAAFLLAFSVMIVADTDKSIGESFSLSTDYAKKFYVSMLIFGLVIVGITIGVGIVSAIFGVLPGVLSYGFTTVIDAGLQIFSVLAGAMFYVEVKKRFKSAK